MQLANIFPNVAISSVRRQMNIFKNHFIPTAEAMQKLVEKNSAELSYNKTKRIRKVPALVSPDFNDEYNHYFESLDLALAQKLNEMQYETEGQFIECCCCYNPVPFENLTQCNAGHLFCLTCVKEYIQTTVFGEERNDIHCLDMESQCQESFPLSSIEAALPKETFNRFQELMQRIEIKKAGLEGLRNCIHCSYCYILDPSDTVFYCRGCNKNWCLKCENADHSPNPCPKKETQSEEAQRKRLEEELTAARLRKCSKCDTTYYKTEGCNKILCSKCGNKMCYTCRQEGIDYPHFCSCNKHSREAKDIKKCAQCHKCILFFKDTNRIDEADIESLKNKRKADTAPVMLDLTLKKQKVL